jgi:hypothetical protein
MPFPARFRGEKTTNNKASDAYFTWMLNTNRAKLDAEAAIDEKGAPISPNPQDLYWRQSKKRYKTIDKRVNENTVHPNATATDED